MRVDTRSGKCSACYWRGRALHNTDLDRRALEERPRPRLTCPGLVQENKAKARASSWREMQNQRSARDSCSSPTEESRMLCRSHTVHQQKRECIEREFRNSMRPEKRMWQLRHHWLHQRIARRRRTVPPKIPPCPTDTK